MTLAHDIIKIKYVNLGYIKKNYPPHLISDEEMFNAFIDLGTGFKSSMIDPTVHFFDDYYPNPFDPSDTYERKNASGEVIEVINLYDVYTGLKQYIIDSIKDHLAYVGTTEAADHIVPDWIYTYMLGEVIYQKSEYLDIYDTLALLKCSNIDNIFTKQACIACYATSLTYISTLTTGVRPPSVFGEPHVIKNLRLET